MSKVIEGEVISGLGVGAKYVSMPTYNLLLTELLDEVPYPGTLNIRIKETLNQIIEECPPSHIKSVLIAGEEKGGFYYWFGDVIGYQQKIPVLIVRPFLTKHPENILEIIAGKNLREELSLKDGDVIKVKIICERIPDLD